MSRRETAVLFAAAVVAAVATPAGAALITSSPTAPPAAAISQPDASGPAFNGAQDFTDNAGPPGQTFVSAVAIPFLGVTVKGFANTGASFGGGVNTGTWTITASQVGAGNVLTIIDQETAVPTAVTDGSAYITINFQTPVALNAGVTYAFDIFSSAGYFGLAKSTADVYAPGAAIQHGTTARTSANGATIANQQTVDRTFFINPVPEPASAGLAGIALLGLLARRRR